METVSEVIVLAADLVKPRSWHIALIFRHLNFGLFTGLPVKVRRNVFYDFFLFKLSTAHRKEDISNRKAGSEDISEVPN